MLEFVMSFPLILILVFGCIQFAHLWVARQVVFYSSYCAARAALVSHQHEQDEAAQRAAEQVCAWIVKGHSAGEADKEIPGWGAIPGSGAVERKTVVKTADVPRWNVRANVRHSFALIVPVAGPVIAWAVNPWKENAQWVEQQADKTGNMGTADLLFHPHVILRADAVIPKPYITILEMGLPASTW
jgi:Flp pilus assembly protein TadG